MLGYIVGLQNLFYKTETLYSLSIISHFPIPAATGDTILFSASEFDEFRFYM